MTAIQPFIYLASPYTHPNPTVREARYIAACKAAARLMQQGEVVFSPIAHSHSIEVIGFDGVEDGEFWKKQDAPYLNCCAAIYVLTLPGWEQSKGVKHEIEVCRQRGVEVRFIEP